jgi:hypothetical protein
VKNIDIVRRKAGTMQASQQPRKNLTTKREAKLLHGMCRSVMPPLYMVSSKLHDVDWLVPGNKHTSQPFSNREVLQGAILRELSQKLPLVRIEKLGVTICSLSVEGGLSRRTWSGAGTEAGHTKRKISFVQRIMHGD